MQVFPSERERAGSAQARGGIGGCTKDLVHARVGDGAEPSGRLIPLGAHRVMDLMKSIDRPWRVMGCFKLRPPLDLEFDGSPNGMIESKWPSTEGSTHIPIIDRVRAPSGKPNFCVFVQVGGLCLGEEM